MQLPIRLFLDHRVNTLVGQSGLFNWWLIHTGTETIGSVTVEMHQSSPNEAIKLESCDKTNLQLTLGQQLKCSTSFEVHKAGHQALEVRVILFTVSGRRWELVTQQEPNFYFEDTAGAATLRIEGSALIKNMPLGTILQVQKNAIVNCRADEPTATSSSFNHQEVISEEHVYEFCLCERSPNGLIPLDLSAFAAFWSSNRIKVDFVDEMGHSKNKTATLQDAYRLQISSPDGGHLTLISRGTSGRYMILSPNSASEVRLVPRQSYCYFPGEFFPGQLDFGDEGEELALAIVTPLPLMAQAVELFNMTGDPPTVNHATPELVIDLLKRAINTPGATLGLAQLNVN